MKMENSSMLLNRTSNTSSSLHAVATIVVGQTYSLHSLDHVILWIISVLTTIGNLTIIAVFCRTPKLRTVTNCFVVSLALSDLLSGAALLPCLLLLGLSHPTVQPAIMFILVAALGNICTCTYDRYIAVTRALLYKAIMTKKLLWKLLTPVWIVAAILAMLPNILGSRMQHSQLFRQIFLGVVITAMIVVFSILVVTYARIFIIARRHVRFMKTQDHPSRLPKRGRQASNHSVDFLQSSMDNIRHDSRDEGFKLRRKRSWINKSKLSLKLLLIDIRYVKLFAMVGMTFVLCWFPFLYINLVADVMLQADLAPMVLLRVSLHTIFVSSFLNPIIYGYYQKTFREAVFGCILSKLGFQRRGHQHSSKFIKCKDAPPNVVHTGVLPDRNGDTDKNNDFTICPNKTNGHALENVPLNNNTDPIHQKDTMLRDNGVYLAEMLSPTESSEESL